jgi:hypothetical protein
MTGLVFGALVAGALRGVGELPGLGGGKLQKGSSSV